MKQEEYEKILDLSIIVSLGKLFLFREIWNNLNSKIKRKMTDEEIRMARRFLREIIDRMEDSLFFVPPELAISRESIETYLKERFEKEKLKKRLIDEFKMMMKTYSTLEDLF
ncbi:MAG: hypothetical protein QXJ62_06550 [Nitrososphaeria archaeon]